MIDSGKITILAALDMSAVFDTLDHTTLLHRLEHTFGLSVLSTPGFIHTQQIVHLLLELTRHLPLVTPHSLAFRRVQFLALSFLFCSFHQ